MHKTRYVSNIREMRCFLSFISKYEVFDQPKLLEYSKRAFRILF